MKLRSTHVHLGLLFKEVAFSGETYSRTVMYAVYVCVYIYLSCMSLWCIPEPLTNQMALSNEIYPLS